MAQPRLQAADYTVGWICALPIELAAAQEMLDEEHDMPIQNRSTFDPNFYTLGRVGDHNIVIACLPAGRTGTQSAAAVAARMRSSFPSIQFGLMVGIGGGVPSAETDIRLGDVVISQPFQQHGGVVQYDSGKTATGGQKIRTGWLNAPPAALLNAVSQLRALHYRGRSHLPQYMRAFDRLAGFSREAAGPDVLFEATYDHISGPTCAKCDRTWLIERIPRTDVMLHCGTIASGNQVIRDGNTRDRISTELGGVMCFEMEAAGLMNDLPSLVIRGICDYADSHKNKRWQPYAAATAAACAKDILAIIPATNIARPAVREVSQVGQSHNSIQQWLSPADVNDDLYRYENDCMSKSCDWALKSIGMRRLLASKTNDIMRIGGAPGSGKSTLTAFIIRHLMQTTSSDVLYFFCKGTDEGRQKPFQVLRTLISQLLPKDESLYPWFETLQLQSGKKTAESFAVLHHALKLCLTNTSRKLIYLVVDALDECQEGYMLASALIESTKQSKGIVKVILTCREDPKLLGLFTRQHPELIISPTAVRNPIRDYVTERVSQCKHIAGTQLGFWVQTQVTKAADGSWLYARLMMDEIQRLPSAASIQRTIQDVPTGIYQLYHQIFSTMEKSLSPLQLKLSEQVFLWLDMTNFVQVGRSTLDREILDIVLLAATGEQVFDSVDVARQLCSPLVEFHKVMGTRNITVDFIHHTAAQFVREFSQSTPPTPIPTILKPQQLKQLYRGCTSVWYFTSCEKSTLLLETLRSCPPESMRHDGAYFEMAYGLWNALFMTSLPKNLDDEGIAQATRLCDTMTRFLQSTPCLKWVEMAMIINYNGGFTNLYDNIVRALEAAEEGVKSNIKVFSTYSVMRKIFLIDYAYVVHLTGPAYESEATPLLTFSGSYLGNGLLALGQQWAHLYK